mmetsp:Transcript_43652/g.105287  ORF Transcript_43652/g.105287 Transcript_43652/m.105287 type:complete len:209 (+) Transcript_43652:264-890(+)
MAILVRQGHPHWTPTILGNDKLKFGGISGPIIRASRPSQFSVEFTRSLQNNQNGWNSRILVFQSFSRINLQHHDFKFWNWWCVSNHIGSTLCIIRSRINGRSTHAVGQHFHQIVNILEFGGQSRSYHIVTACHALDDFTRHIGMGFIGRHEEGFTGSNQQIIHKERGHGTSIVGKLLGQSQYSPSTLTLPGRFLMGVSMEFGLFDLQS